MNIEDLTLREIKQLKSLLNDFNCEKPSNTIYSKYIGKYVLCRTRNEGVNAGYVKQMDNTAIILEECRRLYYHKPLNNELSWYEGVAESGLSSVSKVSSKATKVIVEDYYGLTGTPRTLEDIGGDFNLTKERVRQIKEKAIRKLRHNVHDLYEIMNENE